MSIERLVFKLYISEWGSFVLLRFFGKYPTMDIRPLLLECHGSEIIFDWSRKF